MDSYRAVRPLLEEDILRYYQMENANGQTTSVENLTNQFIHAHYLTPTRLTGGKVATTLVFVASDSRLSESMIVVDLFDVAVMFEHAALLEPSAVTVKAGADGWRWEASDGQIDDRLLFWRFIDELQWANSMARISSNAGRTSLRKQLKQLADEICELKGLDQVERHQKRAQAPAAASRP